MADITFVLLGLRLLWPGFNTNSAVATNSLVISAFATANVAASDAGLA